MVAPSEPFLFVPTVSYWPQAACLGFLSIFWSEGQQTIRNRHSLTCKQSYLDDFVF